VDGFQGQGKDSFIQKHLIFMAFQQFQYDLPQLYQLDGSYLIILTLLACMHLSRHGANIYIHNIPLLDGK
jgi:hypothetical protein